MTGLAGRLRAEGIDVPEVSVGSTPTTLLHDGFEGITEIRPGNYVFMDRTQVALGVAASEDVALWVATTVVSANDRYAIVDAGSKVLSSDRGPHGSTSVAGYGLAWRCDAPDAPPLPLVALSEEHGFVEHGGRPPAVGTRMVILPNHSCTVVNLAEELIVAAEDGTTQRWPVDARAHVR
jgi:D-serine deaminase-like pyridoxal phosphate-dependent protein